MSSDSESQSPPPSSSPVIEEVNDVTEQFSGAKIEEILEKDQEKALQAKTRGNQFYAQSNFDRAIENYNEAIILSPDDDHENLSIYYSNRAACYLLINEYDKTISDCSASVEHNKSNVKAWIRRAKAFEKEDKLQEAQDDWKQVCELDPSNTEAKESVIRLTSKINEKNEKMKDEMMGKLKDLGNTVLGKFGLSLDNFKATKDPNTGSYSINFQR